MEVPWIVSHVLCSKGSLFLVHEPIKSLHASSRDQSSTSLGCSTTNQRSSRIDLFLLSFKSMDELGISSHGRLQSQSGLFLGGCVCVYVCACMSLCISILSCNAASDATVGLYLPGTVTLQNLVKSRLAPMWLTLDMFSNGPFSSLFPNYPPLGFHTFSSIINVLPWVRKLGASVRRVEVGVSQTQ